MTMNQPSTNELGVAEPSLRERDGEKTWTPRWIAALVIVVVLGELATLSYSLVATALPGIGIHFQTSDLGWTITVANLVTAVAVALIGKLADLRGKRALLLVVTAISAGGAAVSALAPTYEIFLVGRGMQGFLYVIPALGYSLIRDVFPKKLVAFAIAVTFTGAGVLFVISPFLAGWLIDSFGALSVFWLIAGIQALCIVGIVVALPESPLRVKSRLDWPSANSTGCSSGKVIRQNSRQALAPSTLAAS